MRERVTHKRVIQSTPDKTLDAVVTIPAYREGYAIIDCLHSIVTQDVPNGFRFAITVVINNPPNAPTEVYEANMRTYALLQAMRSKKRVVFSGDMQKDFLTPQNAKEKTEQIKTIQESGVDINIVDIFSEECASDNSNVGLARQAAMEASINMLKDDKRALYITTDADTKLDPLFLRDAATLFEKRTDIHALSGRIVADIANIDAVSRRAYEDSLLYNDLAYYLSEFVVHLSADGIKDMHNVGKERASYLCGSATVVTKGALEKTNGYKHVNTGEDMQLGIDLREVGYTVVDARLAPNVAVYTSARRSSRTDYGFGRTIQNWSEVPFREHLVTRFKHAKQADALMDDLAGIHADELCDDTCAEERVRDACVRAHLEEYEINCVLRAYRAGETTPSLFTNSLLLGAIKRIFSDERFVVPLAEYVREAEEIITRSEFAHAWRDYVAKQPCLSTHNNADVADDDLRAKIKSLIYFFRNILHADQTQVRQN